MDALIVFVFTLLITIGAFAIVTFTVVVPLIDKTTYDLSQAIDSAIQNVTIQGVARDIQNQMVVNIIEDDIITIANATTTHTHAGTASVNTSAANVNTSSMTTNTNTNAVSVNTSTVADNVSNVLSTLTAAVGGTNCAQGQYYANGTCVTPVQNAKTNPVLVQNLQTVVHDLITLVANTQ